MVEQVFVKTGRVLHLHVGAQVIRTTPEHPFYAYNKGWAPAGTLAAGDRILTEARGWVPVDEVFDTGDYARVYNLRVGDWHTYFVGSQAEGPVWAHNEYSRNPVENARIERDVYERLIAYGVPESQARALAELGAAPGTNGQVLVDALNSGEAYRQARHLDRWEQYHDRLERQMDPTEPTRRQQIERRLEALDQD